MIFKLYIILPMTLNLSKQYMNLDQVFVLFFILKAKEYVCMYPKRTTPKMLMENVPTHYQFDFFF